MRGRKVEELLVDLDLERVSGREGASVLTVLSSLESVSDTVFLKIS